MKTKKIVLGLVILFSLQSFSQENSLFQTFSWNESSTKEIFVYKTVEGHEIKANIFLPNTNGMYPVIVYFHGGGFIFGNRDQGLNSSIKEKLLASNYAIVSADYRLAPETKLQEILNDVGDIIRWLRENGVKEFNIDTNKIAVAGGSAGGYLALSTGFNQDYAPNAIVAISTPTGFSTENIQMGDLSILNQAGPYDIVKDSIVSHGDYDSRMQLWRFLARNGLALYEIFGFDPSQYPEKLENFKLTSNIDSDYPPTLLIHAKNDHLVDLQQVNDFYNYLKQRQIKTELYLVENGHSSELINQNPDAIDKMIDFLKIQMP